MSLSGGRRVSHETQSARLNLQSKENEKLEVGTLTSGVVTVSDHMYVSGFGIVLEEEAPVFFGQSMSSLDISEEGRVIPCPSNRVPSESVELPVRISGDCWLAGSRGSTSCPSLNGVVVTSSFTGDRT